MKKITTLVLLCFFTFSKAQKGFKITYLKSSNGTLIENQDPVLVFANEFETLLTTKNMQNGKS